MKRLTTLALGAAVLLTASVTAIAVEDRINETEGLTLVRNVSSNGIPRFHYVRADRGTTVTMAPYVRGYGVGTHRTSYAAEPAERGSYLLHPPNGRPHLVHR